MKRKKLNKKLEHKRFVFKLPPVDGWRDKETAKEIIQKVCPEGWKPDMGFNSQDSFFSKDGKEYARTTIRRWV